MCRKREEFTDVFDEDHVLRIKLDDGDGVREDESETRYELADGLRTRSTLALGIEVQV